ncbi:hypothetical protein LCGC14_2780980 [marine sediment metagenome]|uniref:Phage protein n=1 Tax=marine sediment metagenome TaxID=412755 RepID=A0A0F8YTA3_9ZZZZ
MGKYRKKPVVIEAVQWDGESGTANEFIGEAYGGDWEYATAANSAILIHALDGKTLCQVEDWIIKEGNGIFSLCKPDIFEATYEPVED